MDDQMIMTIAAGATLITEIIIGIYFYKRFKRVQRLKSMDALSARATISKKTTYNTKNSTIYKISYDFNDYKGVDFSGKNSLPHERWEQLEEGDNVAITYVRDHPKTSAPTDQVENVIRSTKIVLIMLGLSIPMLPMLAGFMLLTTR